MNITRSEMKKLLKNQQGELDAVLMYNALADAVSSQREKQTFRQLAAEEGRHAAVFRSYTHRKLRPKKTKAVLLPWLYRLLGRRGLYPLIAKGEYLAYRKYERLIEKFPKVSSVRSDEKRHGDIVSGLLK